MQNEHVCGDPTQLQHEIMQLLCEFRPCTGCIAHQPEFRKIEIEKSFSNIILEYVAIRPFQTMNIDLETDTTTVQWD